MRLLLDTHILLWWTAGYQKLPGTLRTLIASPEADVAVSVATLWEIAVKTGLGRIDVDLQDLHATSNADGFSELPVTIAHILRLVDLPENHRDPFDRLLIAQSIA